MIADSRGEVSVSTVPDLTGLTVTGPVQLGNTNVLGSLTANALTSLTSVLAPTGVFQSIDVSSAVIDTQQSRSITLVGDLSSGVLTFSDTGGLLLNSVPVNGTGSEGATGPAGPRGADGVNGINGSPGSIGATGPAGSAGSIGATGPAGSSGSAGSIGATGPAGEFTATPVPFFPISDEATLEDVIQSFNLFLQTVNGLLVTVQIPEITNFRATTIRDTSVILEWDLIGSGYLFTIAGAGLHTDISGRTFTLTGLAAATLYTVTITGQNNRVFATESKQLTFITLSPPRPVISNVIVSASVVSASITWSSAPAADTYTINIEKVSPSGPGVEYTTSLQEILVTDLTPDSSFRVTVTGTLNGVTGDPSTAVMFATQAIPAVSDFSVNTITSSSANLIWSSLGGEYVYTITYPGFTYTTAPGVLMYELTGLSANTFYTISIVGVLGSYSGPPAGVTFQTAASGPVAGFIKQTIYPLSQTPSAQVPFGFYFDQNYYGSPAGPATLRDMQANGSSLNFDADPGLIIYQNSFYLKPPMDISGMVLWIACDDGCAVRYTDPDTLQYVYLVNNGNSWLGGPSPAGGGPYIFPSNASGDFTNDPAITSNGILLNLSSQKYYKFDFITNNRLGSSQCSLAYTIPVEATPGVPVTYTTHLGGRMYTMSHATLATTIPRDMGAIDPHPPIQNDVLLIDYTWYYCDPL